MWFVDDGDSEVSIAMEDNGFSVEFQPGSHQVDPPFAEEYEVVSVSSHHPTDNENDDNVSSSSLEVSGVDKQGYNVYSREGRVYSVTPEPDNKIFLHIDNL